MEAPDFSSYIANVIPTETPPKKTDMDGFYVGFVCVLTFSKLISHSDVRKIIRSNLYTIFRESVRKFD